MQQCKSYFTYYRSRTAIENPNLTATLNDTEQGYADYAIDEYRFTSMTIT